LAPQPTLSISGQIMENRWAVLALLFTVRLTMAFQFQVVGSVAPAIIETYAVTLAEIGLLISLFYAPGIAFALPGGEIGRRFGEKRIVLLGLALMTAGGLVMALAPTWPWLLAGRIVAGVGGILLNVLMTKMVADWFAGREIATAMAIFVNSWPAGIALGLVVLPVIQGVGGLAGVNLATAVAASLGLMLLAALYRPPQVASSAKVPAAAWPEGLTLNAVVIAGSIWGLYNAALAMVFGYGTALLTERGWTLVAAGAATSLVLWLVSLSVPAGGVLADQTGRNKLVMLGGFVAFAACLFAATRTEHVLPAFFVLGLVGGLSAGPIMSLPARVLAPEARAVGMGLYFSIFYAFAVGAPILAGWSAAQRGTSQVAFDLGAVMLVVCIALYRRFERIVLSLPKAAQT
jgi:MFS family permease